MGDAVAQNRDELLTFLEKSEVSKLLEPVTKAQLVMAIRTGSIAQLLNIRAKLLEYEQSWQEVEDESLVVDRELKARRGKDELRESEIQERQEAEVMAKKLLAELDTIK